MITKKEKIAIQIIYKEYKKDKSPEKIYMKTDELIRRSCGRLSLSDLHAMILHGNSQYVGFQDATDSTVKIKQIGISYMEGRPIRIIKGIAFWVFGISAVVAALYAVLAYYCK